MDPVVQGKEEILKALERLAGTRVMVYGDFVLDEFLHGRIDRISREAPVFIVLHQSSQFRLGCASNAVANLSALGADVVPVGAVGADEAGDRLLELLRRRGVPTDSIYRAQAEQTAVKTRVIAGVAHSIKQQILRLDRLGSGRIGGKHEEPVRGLLAGALPACDAVLISDYDIGCLTPACAKWLIGQARKSGKPVLVDSRHRLLQMTGATAATPNQPEVEECTGAKVACTEELIEAGADLLERLGCEALLATRGPDGMMLFQAGREPVDIPAFGDEEIVDVTGAGDTVIAVFTLAVAGGAGFEAAARLANVAGGLTVRKKGTSTVSREEISSALSGGQ